MINNTARALARMTPLVPLPAEGKRSSKYFPNSASMASSRAAVMRKRYNLGIMHVRTDPTTYCSGILPMARTHVRIHGATHAPQTDSKPSGWTALKRVKRATTVLKPSRRLYSRPDGFRTVRTALKRACGFTLVPNIYMYPLGRVCKR